MQNAKLDEFHLKDQIQKMEADIEKGNIITSMNLQNNVHAAKFKNFLTNPLKVGARAGACGPAGVVRGMWSRGCGLKRMGG